MGSAKSNWQTFTLVAAVCHFLTSEGGVPEVRGEVGGSVELECSFLPSDPAAVQSASPRVVEWVRQGLDIPVLIKFGSYPPRVHPQYEGRVTLVRTTALRLGGLQLDDQGPYECRILLLDKPTDELRNGTWTLLSVTAPPTFTKVPPPLLEALVGSHVSLTCVATGNPAPTITWTKDGSVIQRGDNKEGTLSLRAVSMQSAGQYTCHASNSQGNATRVAKVKIKGPPVIVIPPKNTALNMSQNALLQCQAVADPPNMTYVWLKGGENVHHIESLKSRVKIMVDGTLLISSLIPEDAGNYTCVPTNGLLTPPTASANLTVMHPAKALQMPQETYLPTGMGGKVSCLVAAWPPLLRVDWVKDGEPLDLSLYPGWTLKPEGSVFMATVNDDAAGVYSCTPYNSYGTMGSSGPTDVILQDPPSFSIAPEKQYRLEAGGTLLIPCQGKTDPTNKISWSKVDPIRRISYSIELNGSLLLQPLTKDHQGAWECSASNRVASVKTTTQVFVLGTSPHAAASLSVSPGVKQANVSWEAGFDGGSAQTFSVWVKKISAGDDGKRDWFSVPVPASAGTGLQVTGLSPATNYQFSVLSQNKMGTGPFSDIAIARTLDPPRRRNKLKPPTSLSANLSSAGVVLQWLHDAQRPPITGFILQSRPEEGKWFNLDEGIGANTSEMVVPGLHKDCVYELRLLSRRGELLSEPSPSVNVSTIGMEMYPATSRLLEFVPEPLLAGVLSGVGFMFLALVLLLGFAWLVSHRRDRRRRRKKDEPPTAIYKCSPSIKTSGTGSPDSVLKKSLLPANSLYPTSSSTTTTSSSLQTDRSSFSSENHHRRKQFTSNYSRGSLAEPNSALISPHIEMISRGVDGRFIQSQYENDTLSVHSKKSGSCDRPPRVRRSASLHSEREDRKDLPFVLSVDLPSCRAETESGSQRCGMPLHLPYVPDQKTSYDGLPDLTSMCSNSSLSTIPHYHRELTPTFPVLPHIRSGLSQASTTASTLVLQMEHERERANLSRCLRLAEEREELERELQRYTLERTSMREAKRGQLDEEGREDSGDEIMWEYKSRTLPHRYSQGNKDSSFSSSTHWEGRPPASPSDLIPSRNRLSLSPPASCFKSGSHRPSSFVAKQTSLRSEEEEEAGGFPKDRLTLPHLSSKHQRHERAQAAPEGSDNSPQSTVLEMQTSDSYSEAPRQNNLSRGSLSTLSFHSNKYPGRSNSALDAFPDLSKEEVALTESIDKHLCVEMSVDEPETELPEAPPPKPMLHHRIASHVQHGRQLSQRGHPEVVRRSTSFNYRSPASVQDFIELPDSSRSVERELWRGQVWGPKKRSQSLDFRRRKESDFLTPDAWINSLSQENCSVRPSSRADPPFWKPPSSLHKNMYKSPTNHHPVPQAASHSSLTVDLLSRMSSSDMPTPNHNVPCHYEPRGEAPIFPNAAKWPVAYQEPMQEAEGYTGAVREASICLPPNNNNEHRTLEAEAGGLEGVPDSEGSYSSYASSGRGSMEAANGRLSLCHLSPTLISSPETGEDMPENLEDEESRPTEANQGRRASVDENYEWDAADLCPQPGDHEGLPPSLNLLKPARHCSLPSMQCSGEELKNCTQLSLLPGHQSSCSAEPEPDTVLF